MILAATMWFDDAVPFPSVWTLVPVLGTCLIILFAERATLTARLLSLGPLVGIGLISYSAYLWHQPIFAFARIRMPGEVPGEVMMALAGLALVLAWASWRFVEQPVRGRAPLVLPSRRGILMASLAGIAVFAGAGLWGKGVDGFPGRLDIARSPFLARLYDQTTEHVTAASLCPRTRGPVVPELCIAYAPDGPERRIAVLGDSHSRVILPAFEPVSEALDATIILGNKPGCPPLLGVWLVRGGAEARICRESVRGFAEGVREAGADTVILVARWSLYATGDYDGADPKFALTPKPGRRFLSGGARLAGFEAGLRRTVEYFRDAGMRVILVSQVPQQKIIPGVLVQSAMMLGLSEPDARMLFEDSFVLQGENDRLQAQARSWWRAWPKTSARRSCRSTGRSRAATAMSGSTGGMRFTWTMITFRKPALNAWRRSFCRR